MEVDWDSFAHGLGTIFGQLDWGNVPQWASAFLTSGSLTLGFYILLRDRRKVERADAEKVVCWFDHGDQGQIVTVHNTTDRVIHEVGVVAWLGNPGVYEGWQGVPLIEAARTGTIEVPRWANGYKVRASFVRFRMTDGNEWMRDLRNSDLVRLPKHDHVKGALREYVADSYGSRWTRRAVVKRLRRRWSREGSAPP